MARAGPLGGRFENNGRVKQGGVYEKSHMLMKEDNHFTSKRLGTVMYEFEKQQDRPLLEYNATTKASEGNTGPKPTHLREITEHVTFLTRRKMTWTINDLKTAHTIQAETNCTGASKFEVSEAVLKFVSGLPQGNICSNIDLLI